MGNNILRNRVVFSNRYAEFLPQEDDEDEIAKYF
jgi:hypothetical protein